MKIELTGVSIPTMTVGDLKEGQILQSGKTFYYRSPTGNRVLELPVENTHLGIRVFGLDVVESIRGTLLPEGTQITITF